MNHGPSETERFFSELARLASTALSPEEKAPLEGGSTQVALFPPAVSLDSALQRRNQVPFRVEIGAQNVHWESQGAFTGEVSGSMIRQLGVAWALVGHSERRQYFGETNATALKRTESLLKQEFHVVACIGENLEERKGNRTQEVIAEQFLNSIPTDAAPHASSKRLVIAYEPVWAIGTGRTPTEADIAAIHGTIRGRLAARFGASGQGMRILYGGSMKPGNAKAILALPNVDGGLVGGASLVAADFLAIARAAG